MQNVEQPEGSYHVTTAEANGASDDVLRKWAADPLCIEADTIAALLAERNGRAWRALAIPRKAEQHAPEQHLPQNPFDPRTEISADARHVVKHLWILFVLLPFIIGVLWAVLSAMK